MKIAIIGAGIGGLSAAWDLAGAGHEVIVYEGSDKVGGLAGGFRPEGWEWSVEKYYHHWFQSDAELLKIAEEIGVRDKVFYPQPVTALYHQGKFYAFDSPIAVLKFPGIHFIDRLRFGFVGAYLRFSKNWKSFEKHTAHEWLRKWMGKRAYETLWEPMLKGKFGEEYYRDVNMAWFWARIHVRTPQLGTFEGGFQAFCDEFAEAVRGRGATILLETPVERIESKDKDQLALRTNDGEETFDRVLSTTSPELVAKMAPDLPEDYLSGVRNLKSLGAVVLTLSMDRPLGPEIYWYNLPKSEGFPFLCLVEHTQFVDKEHFGGNHIVYCGDYLPPDHRYFSMTKEEILEEYLPGLQKINPEVSKDWVKESWMFRAQYAQPVPFVNHSENIPSIRTPIPGLYWASMSQVYPWDRGTNFAVEIGRRAAKSIQASKPS
ncbi:MAG: NAD(P)/FAD-dependent oxidoreductase [Candidatus Omnitrophica bacterium]|nr:NAD(P)/FAD-dependent oxidoreductase [Candidatus Omnitrophota bacterium]